MHGVSKGVCLGGVIMYSGFFAMGEWRATLAPREIWPAIRAETLLSVLSSFSIRVLSYTSGFLFFFSGPSVVPISMIGSINSSLSSSLRARLRIVSTTLLLSLGPIMKHITQI